jgi:ribosomal protein S18 acetylase RimI-like enzyme
MDDVTELQHLSRETFYEAFHHLNTDENMKNYLETAFDGKKLEREIRNPSSTFYFIYVDQELAGYTKINVGEAQSDNIAVDALEVERIYVHSKFQGQGLGKHLIDKAIDVAYELNKKYAWLGVWEINHRAIKFYEEMGFMKSGTHPFYMGDEKQTDFIMIRNL